MRFQGTGNQRSPGLPGALAILFLLAGLASLAPLGSAGASPQSSPALSWLYAPLAMRSYPAPTPTTTPPGDCSTAPVLLTPADGATLSTLIPIFEWDSGANPSGTDRWLEIFDDPGLAHPVYAMISSHRGEGRRSFRIRTNLAPATVYYWRAYLMCGEVQGPYSEVHSFTTGSGGEILPGPTLLAPPSGTTLPGLTVTLRWSPVSGAMEYLVHFRADLHYTIVVQGTEITLPAEALRANTTYEWWVAARNDYAWGNESAPWQFTTGAGESSPHQAAPAADRSWTGPDDCTILWDRWAADT